MAIMFGHTSCLIRIRLIFLQHQPRFYIDADMKTAYKCQDLKLKYHVEDSKIIETPLISKNLTVLFPYGVITASGACLLRNLFPQWSNYYQKVTETNLDFETLGPEVVQKLKSIATAPSTIKSTAFGRLRTATEFS